MSEEETKTFPVLKPADEITDADLAEWPELEVGRTAEPSRAESSTGFGFPGSPDRPSRPKNSSPNLGRAAASSVRNESPITGRCLGTGGGISTDHLGTAREAPHTVSFASQGRRR